MGYQRLPEKAQKVFKAIFAIAKFGWAAVGFGINKVMDGLTNLFGKGFDEGPIKRTFRFMGGFLQLASGIAALVCILHGDAMEVDN